MLANAVKFGTAAAAFALFTVSANAETVHPSCVKVKDKVKCNCLFTNGATIDNFGGRNRIHIWTLGQHDAYIACMKRNGREP
jgi:hypothetical protein